HLSLEIDGQLVRNIDCANPDDPANTTLAQIIAYLNNAFGRPVAGEQEGRLLLISPSTGAASHIVLHQADAADARTALFGTAPQLAIGEPRTPAVLTGAIPLNRPVDLSKRPIIRLRVDDGDVVDINCAGETPAKT